MMWVLLLEVDLTVNSYCILFSKEQILNQIGYQTQYTKKQQSN